MFAAIAAFSSSLATLLTTITSNNISSQTNTLPILPKWIVFDLDNTLWNRPRFKKGGKPFTPINDGLNGISGSNGEILDLFPASRETLRILNDYNNNIHAADADKNGSRHRIGISFVSCTHRPQWAKEFITTLKIDETRTVADCLINPTDHVIIRDGSKKLHIREMCQKMDIKPQDVLFFDDRKKDVLEVRRLGITAIHCPYGLVMDDVELGFSLYAGKKSKQ